MGLDHGFIHKRKGQEEVNYQFRKANHIHAYMIDNFHGGEDNQKDFRVPILGIIEFKEVLTKVIASLEASPKETIQVESGWDKNGKTFRDEVVFTDTSVAEELLPTQSGFFFGGTEYDEWYLDQCKEALDMCNKILESNPKGTVTYWCWW